MPEATPYSNRRGEPLYIGNLYAGAHAFLCMSGPSFARVDKAPLLDPSIITMSVNNGPASPAGIRTRLWTMTDDCKSFAKSIFDDAGILKFVPAGKRGDKCAGKLWDNFAWCEANRHVNDCPSVVYYSRHDTKENYFRPETFLTGPAIVWGNHEDRCECGWMRPPRIKICPQCKRKDDDCQWSANKCVCGYERPEGVKKCPQCGDGRFGSRSVFLVALRILYDLGFRSVYILGADFEMKEGGQNYHFEQDRSKHSVKNNNKTYARLNDRFTRLQPHFLKAGFEVYNCTDGGNLIAFPRMALADALARARAHIPERENTAGMYDRKQLEKDAKKKDRAGDVAGRDSGPYKPVEAGPIPAPATMAAAPRTLAEFEQMKKEVARGT